MSKYNVNIKKLALLLLPTMLRRPVMSAMCYSLVSPICGVHFRFMAYRQDVGYRLTHNGQVCYLRAVLNDAFDPQQRRIELTDAQELGTLLLHARATGPWQLTYRRTSGKALVINRRGFGGASGYDFLVKVPEDLTPDNEKRMQALINIYKTASKRYLIIKNNG